MQLPALWSGCDTSLRFVGFGCIHPAFLRIADTETRAKQLGIPQVFSDIVYFVHTLSAGRCDAFLIGEPWLD